MDSLIQRIIVPVDFGPASERAARFGCALANNLSASVHLIHVVPRSAKPPYLAAPAERPDRLYREARTMMTALVRRLHRVPRMMTEIRTGVVDEEITSAVVAYGGDLVVMATHGRSGLPHLLYGSVAEQVIRTARCPVLVMRESGKVQVRRAATAARGIQHFAKTA